MFRVKRYDVVKLVQCLAQLGWDELTALPCGNPREKSGIVMLFRKRGPLAPPDPAKPAEA